MSIHGECLCGTVRFSLDAAPQWLIRYNGSVGQKYGALWVHSTQQRIILECEASDTLSYSFDDRSIGYHSCILCGCTTHWEGLNEDNMDRIGVNGLLLSADITDPLEIRNFDGPSNI